MYVRRYEKKICRFCELLHWFYLCFWSPTDKREETLIDPTRGTLSVGAFNKIKSADENIVYQVKLLKKLTSFPRPFDIFVEMKLILLFVKQNVTYP